MNKIPTVFVRTHDQRGITEVFHPDCVWVANGEGVVPRKFDGVCVMFDGTAWWARREVKGGKVAPEGFRPVTEPDPITGKVMGWEPIEQSSFAKFFTEAMDNTFERDGHLLGIGTYELCGPKINGNPDNLPDHQLIEHGGYILSEFTESLNDDVTARTFSTIRATVSVYAKHGYEGIVWHHPDGRMAKIKVRDYPRGTFE